MKSNRKIWLVLTGIFALIAVVSMASATAIGSFFFIRKRKEQN